MALSDTVTEERAEDLGGLRRRVGRGGREPDRLGFDGCIGSLAGLGMPGCRDRTRGPERLDGARRDEQR